MDVSLAQAAWKLEDRADGGRGGLGISVPTGTHRVDLFLLPLWSTHTPLFLDFTVDCIHLFTVFL